MRRKRLLGVHDLRSAARLFELLGGTFVTGADNPEKGFRWIHYRLPGGTKIEAPAPVSHDCFLWRFLRSRGEGVHHLTFKVSSVSEAARRAEEAGLKVVGVHLDPGVWSECFIHPSSAHGTLIQLAEWPDEPRSPTTLELRVGRKDHLGLNQPGLDMRTGKADCCRLDDPRHRTEALGPQPSWVSVTSAERQLEGVVEYLDLRQLADRVPL